MAGRYVESRSEMTVAALEAPNGDLVRLLFQLGVPLSVTTARQVAFVAHDSTPGILQAFVDHGWDVNEIAHGFRTSPLQLGTASVPLTRCFLENGANPNIVTDHGFKPFDTAVTKPPPTAQAVINLLISAGAKLNESNALHNAIAHIGVDADCYSVMEFLTGDLGYPINALSQAKPHHPQIKARDYRSTALHWAVKARLNGRRQRGTDMLARIKWLLDHGADVCIQDSNGRTPVDLVAVTPNAEGSTSALGVATTDDASYRLLQPATTDTLENE